MKIIIIDNYDSFTYNLYHYTAEITGVIPQVFYNDKLSWEQFKQYNPDAVIISPGPGSPTKKKDFGISGEIIKKTKLPLLGVCLGHQGIGAMFGAKIAQAPEIMHGRTSNIYHIGTGIFEGIPQGFSAVRYHSLIIDRKTLSNDLIPTAWTEDDILMGIQHRKKPLYGVQFHPESIGTIWGKQILKNFLTQEKKE